MPPTIDGTLPTGELDVKRFYMPGVVLKGQCPNCRAEFAKDFTDEYLSYPSVNKPFEHGMYCDACEHEWTVPLLLTVKLEVAR